MHEFHLKCFQLQNHTQIPGLDSGVLLFGPSVPRSCPLVHRPPPAAKPPPHQPPPAPPAPPRYRPLYLISIIHQEVRSRIHLYFCCFLIKPKSLCEFGSMCKNIIWNENIRMVLHRYNVIWLDLNQCSLVIISCSQNIRWLINFIWELLIVSGIFCPILKCLCLSLIRLYWSGYCFHNRLIWQHRKRELA